MKKSAFYIAGGCLVLLGVAMFGLNSCYREKDREYLFITFDDNNINSIFLEKYVDSIRNKNLKVPDSIKYTFLQDNQINQNSRFLYFTDDPEEWYLISFDLTPCWIVNVYNRQLLDESVNSKAFLGNEEVKRIQTRFRNEILKPAFQYGKAHHLPDSVLFNTQFL